MRDAASGLTNDRKSIKIYESPDKENALIAEFSINRARPADVVGRIGRHWGRY